MASVDETDEAAEEIFQQWSSPSSFKLQIESFADEYQSLHAYARVLAEENSRLRGPADSSLVADLLVEPARRNTLPNSINNSQRENQSTFVWESSEANAGQEIFPGSLPSRVAGSTRATVSVTPGFLRGSTFANRIQGSCVSRLTARGSAKSLYSQALRSGSTKSFAIGRIFSDQDTRIANTKDDEPAFGSENSLRHFATQQTTTGGGRASIGTGGGLRASVGTNSTLHFGGGGLFPKWFDPGNSTSTTNSETFGPAVSWTAAEDNMSNSCTISPMSHARLSWDLFAFLCLLIELWMIPFELIFLEKCATPRPFQMISHVITVFFCCDIILNFCTGFVEHDKVVMSCRRIFSNYVRLWLWVDLVATVPFEFLLNSDSGSANSVARFGKASRAYKTVRYLKLLRVMRLVKISEQVSKVAHHFQFFANFRHLLVPLQVAFFLAVFAHLHGCLWALLQPELLAVVDFEAALDRYFESFWWAYTAVSVGSVGSVGPREQGTHPWGIFLLEMLIASERLLFGVLGSMKVVFHGLRFIDEAQMVQSNMQVLTYLQKKKVSFQTQTQVQFCLTDTCKALKQQSFFNAMNRESLPDELRRTISGEIWIQRLMSLGMIAEISYWHPDFLMELAQLVEEEVYPSKLVLFKLGQPAFAAYHIIEGELAVARVQRARKIPNFTAGMWVGENALASSTLRRGATFTTVTITSLMVVSSDAFHETLSHFGLMEKFQTFCGEYLWRGICGRCGQLGDHFSDTCRNHKRTSTVLSRLSAATDSINRNSSAPIGDRTSSMGAADSRKSQAQRSVGSRNLSRELLRYLAQADLSWIGDILIEKGIYDLNDLKGLDTDLLHAFLTRELTDAQERALSSKQIKKFQEQQANKVHQALFHEVSRLHHLMFLSHYKLEAGTEAALLRTEIEHAIAKDPGSLGHRFEQPVFLDSDDLSNLADLQQRVRQSHNLVLLLTKGVLTRPWCLVEILTAWREGVRIQPVIITKPGSEFGFPDEAFYTSLRDGGMLDVQALDCIEQHGFTMEQLEQAFRNVFKQIAVPYSPHKATNIRQAEVEKLMKNCRLKQNEVSDRGPSGYDRSSSRTTRKWSQTLKSKASDEWV